MGKKLLFVNLGLLVLLNLGCRNSQKENTTEFESSETLGQETRVSEEKPLARQKSSSSFRNEPINYGKMNPGEFAILAGKFKNSQKAIETSRQLRRKRINNFIYDDEQGSYFVLIGPFVTHSQAERKLKYLEKRGLKDLQIFSSAAE